MSRAQRMWSVGSLVLIGLVLATFAMEWAARPPRDEGLRVLTIYQTDTDKPLLNTACSLTGHALFPGGTCSVALQDIRSLSFLLLRSLISIIGSLRSL